MRIFHRCRWQFVTCLTVAALLSFVSCSPLQNQESKASHTSLQVPADAAISAKAVNTDLTSFEMGELTILGENFTRDVCQSDSAVVSDTFSAPDPSGDAVCESQPNGIADEFTEPEPEQTVAQEVTQLESLGKWEEGKPAEVELEKITYDFPVTINRQVEFYLDFFQNEQRKTFTKWLERSGRYIPMIREELKKAGMPEDLIYLPMIESGYSLTAYSRARAVGPWQFIRGTARLYGLTINNYVDERRDPIKSTQAAIDFLQDLYEQFNSWPLAVAAYNAGPGRVRNAIKRSGAGNFWKLAQGKYLKPETRLYVPKLIAAIIIAKEPEKYGFTDLNYHAPLEYETVKVPRWTSLHAVAVACDGDFEQLRELNRQLRRAITPPGSRLYTLKVPPGKKELVAKNLKRVNATVATRYKTHTVKRGETLTRICKKYNLNKKTLLKANNLRTASLRPGQNLRIPYKTTSYKLLDETNIATRLGPAQITPENLVLHKIQRGETMWDISKKYNVPMHMIAAWNDISDLRRIRAGQQLALYLQDMTTDAPQPQVDLTDTGKESRQAQAELSGSKKHAPKVPSTATVSSLKKNKVNSEESKLTYHMVRGGDTLWTIARMYDVTPEKIRRWNGLESDLIHPGKRLLLKISAADNKEVSRKAI